MRVYKVAATFGSDTVKFSLPVGCKQETLAEALLSARKLGAEAFGLREPLVYPEALKVTITETFED